MQASGHAAVTPAGIRDGEPSALAALVERRSNAVLAYCEAVLLPPHPQAAAAEAFARFRAAVVGIGDAESLDPEQLLLGATRHAAAAFVPPPPAPPAAARGLARRLGRTPNAEVEAQVPALLAARWQGELGAEDLSRLARHLARSPSSREVEAAFARAEAAYQHPPERTVPIGVLSEIMVALATAAPILALPPADDDFAWLELDALGSALPPSPPAASTSATPSPGAASALSVPAAGVAAAAPASSAMSPVSAAIGGTADAASRSEIGVAHPEGAITGAPRGGDAAATASDGLTVAIPAVTKRGGIPRPARTHHLHLPPLGGDGVVYRWVLPGGAIAAAVVATLAIAGVFDGGSPSSTTAAPPKGGVPAVPPAGSPPVRSGTAAQSAALSGSMRRAIAAARRRERAAARRDRAAAEAQAAPATGATGSVPPASVPTPASGTTPSAAVPPSSATSGTDTTTIAQRTSSGSGSSLGRETDDGTASQHPGASAPSR